MVSNSIAGGRGSGASYEFYKVIRRATGNSPPTRSDTARSYQDRDIRRKRHEFSNSPGTPTGLETNLRLSRAGAFIVKDRSESLSSPSSYVSSATPFESSPHRRRDPARSPFSGASRARRRDEDAASDVDTRTCRTSPGTRTSPIARVAARSRHRGDCAYR